MKATFYLEYNWDIYIFFEFYLDEFKQNKNDKFEIYIQKLIWSYLLSTIINSLKNRHRLYIDSELPVYSGSG